MMAGRREFEMSGRRIIVGVDGSKASSAALQWALDEARDRGSDTQVHLVHVTPLEYVSALTGEAIAPRDDPAAEERGRRLLGDLARRVAADGFGDVPVTTQQLTGQIAQSLLGASQDADMLVLGSRGHGGFTGLVLGSVTLACVGYARCPVIVVPFPSRSE